MNQTTKNKLFDLYYDELNKQITIGDVFFVDVELHEDGIWYDLKSRLLAESPQIEYYLDQPPYYGNISIVALDFLLCGADVNGNRKYYEEEAEKIILESINKIT